MSLLFENYKDAKKKWVKNGATPEAVDYSIEKFKKFKDKNILKGHDKDIGQWMKLSFSNFANFVEDLENKEKEKHAESKDTWTGSPEYQAYRNNKDNYTTAYKKYSDRVYANSKVANLKQYSKDKEEASKEKGMNVDKAKWWDSKEYQDYLSGKTDHFSYDDWWENYKEGKDTGISRASAIEKNPKNPHLDILDNWSKEDRKFYKKFLKNQRKSFKEFTKIEYAKIENNHPNLVIHMTDKTTDFLKPIYTNLKCDVLTGAASEDDLIESIKKHDRIIMMGHGGPSGLFGKWGLIIKESIVPVLKEKDNSIFIWCNADKFVEKHGLKGFYTGMFVSEVGEANMMDIKPPVDQKDVDFSNNLYAKIVGSVINGSKDTILAKVKAEYNTEKYPDNRVIKYNEVRQYKA